ncbi:MAG: M20/M25/M40 family metallo-hydrolase [Deltaproteobacteria bacterium]|jgi:tripeptide aminopeptidase|nr:M20/M25/M40 family metallo-hydrolase [Deltaproteobacteria bacterium]
MAYNPIIEEFLELVKIPTHSFKEREIADVLKAKMQKIGMEVIEDKTGDIIGGNCGNLIGRWKGIDSIPAVLFSAHMDRVANPGKIVPIIREDEDRITSSGDTILAADDISGVVSILDGIRKAKASGVPHGDVEVVFSVAEEVGLLGSKHLDVSSLRSKMAYVLDSGGPLGTLVNAAPTQYTFLIRIYGKSSHAGMAPEKGINAINVGAQALMRLREGRLSPISTSNFGIISGGKATNIVCDYLEIKGEARSHNEEELSLYLKEVDKVFKETTAERGARVEIDYTLEYPLFSVKEGDPIIQLASKVLDQLGIKAEVVQGGGGQDGNYFTQKGITAIGLATGYDYVHTEKEEQSISQLIKCGEVVAAIITEVAKINT